MGTGADMGRSLFVEACEPKIEEATNKHGHNPNARQSPAPVVVSLLFIGRKNPDPCEESEKAARH
jgi:hypothetical protein